ncbi:MAG: S9 family peptidase [Saprospiraceae bacterium]|nr:S9 family peptidase [Saprospiraceae bacterium]
MDYKALFLKDKSWIGFAFLLFFTCQVFSQKKQIELADVYEYGVFRTAGIGGFNFLKDGISYTRSQSNLILKFDLRTGKVTDTLFDANKHAAEISGFKMDQYQFSGDESKILLFTKTEALYRYSGFSDVYVFDRLSKSIHRVFAKGKVMYPSFSPASDKVAFVFENNLYYQRLSDGKIVQVTKDGRKNEIINGASDWVYEEEFTLTRAYEWSPDGKNLVFIRTDESEVREFSLEYYKDEAYPEIYRFKYPKVGEKNARLTVWVHHLKKGSNRQLAVHSDMNGMEGYIPRIGWTKNNHQIWVNWINREQNWLKLYLVDLVKNKEQVLYEEKSKYYIDIHDHLQFMDAENSFIWQSEKDGEVAMYLMDGKGNLKNRITPAGKEMTEWYGFSEDGTTAFFQIADQRGMDRQICSVSLNGSNFKTITTAAGCHSAQFSAGAKLMVHTYSQINVPPVSSIRSSDGELIRILEDNSKLKSILNQYQISEVETMSISNRNNEALNALMIKPKDFNPNKRYPVFMYLYGGPGSQQVMNKWNSFRYFGWLQMIAQKGYIVCIVDNRGTGGRGEEFKKMTYLQLGKYETEDQIDAAKYLSTLPFVDGSRIGIFGWSYGAYMSSLCLLKGNDVFKAAIAVAPVTNWKWYDSAYTERYMGTTQSNPDGYRENSPVYFADRLKGNYLLIHGMADDNVHFQNAVEMVNALIHHKKQFDTYFYPNRNHGISGDNATIHLFTKMTQFVYEKI